MTSSATPTPEVRGIDEFSDAEYEHFVAPALKAASDVHDKLREERKAFTRILAAICEKYGDNGRISIPERAFLEDDEGLTLYREDHTYNDEMRFFVRRAPSSPPPTGEGG